MSFEEEFDRIIRQKAGEARYTFDESSWEKARAIVDADRKAGRKPLALFYTAAFIILGLGFAGWAVMESISGDSLPAVAAKKKSSQVIAPQQILPAEAYPAVQQTAGAKENSSPAATASVRPLAKVAVAAVAGSAGMAANASVSGAPVKQAGAADDNTGPGTTAPAQAAALAMAPEPALPEAPAAQPKEEAPVSEALPQEEAAISEPLAPIITGIPLSATEPGLMPLTINDLKVIDEEYYRKNRGKTHFLNVEGGAAYLAGWDVKDGKDGKGMNWFAGVNYGLYAFKKWSIGAGLQVYNVSGISKPFYNELRTEYSFGSAGTRTTITTSELYYAAVPLRISYALGPQSQFGLGLNMGMPVYAKNTVETIALSDDRLSGSGKTVHNGVYEGVNNKNVLLSAFYRTQVGKRLYLTGEAIYGISDIFKNLSQVNKENVMGLRLGLQYTLFDK